MKHSTDGLIEKRAVVADYHHRFTQVAQVIGQPTSRVQVEVIGRFVEQTQVGWGGELRGKTDTSPLTTAQGGKRPSLRLFRVEAESLKHGVHPRMKVITAEVGVLLQSSAIPSGIRLSSIGSQLLEPQGERVQLQTDSDHLTVPRCGSIPNRCRLVEFSMLVEESYPKSWCARHRSRCRIQVTSQKSEDRGFSCAIAPYNTPALTFSECQRQVVENGVATKRNGYIRQG